MANLREVDTLAHDVVQFALLMGGAGLGRTTWQRLARRWVAPRCLHHHETTATFGLNRLIAPPPPLLLGLQPLVTGRRSHLSQVVDHLLIRVVIWSGIRSIRRCRRWLRRIRSVCRALGRWRGLRFSSATRGAAASGWRHEVWREKFEEPSDSSTRGLERMERYSESTILLDGPFTRVP